jgi:CRISPR-associated endonuclease/helicase Cas3
MMIDLWFPVTGQTLPSDHGYPMYGALCRVVPELHEAGDWGLHTLRGRPMGPGIIGLPPGSRLGLRLDTDRIPLALRLAGRRLDVRLHTVTLGPPTITPTEPSPALSARIVTIKSFMEPEPFAEAVRRQLVEIDASLATAKVTLGARKIITIDGRRVVGFSVRISNLSNDASMLIQARGIGGRRKMGCGVFRKSERDLATDTRPPRETAE